LRQESFLWAQDLSTYDAVITWEANIPLISKFFGNHISLFCLLMTITNLVYTKINGDSTGGGTQMPGMKAMMYLMPVMFLFIFNQYSAGLSFYYFVSTLFTIGQTYLFRASIDEQKMLKQLMENKSKPVKKSGFAKRLEEAQRMQREQIKQQAKKRR
jgi:YidC/Oxa1 family membrane protein insertase